MKKTYFFVLSALISLIMLIIFKYFSFNDNKLHIIICDVGQGDAILIIMPDQAQILIDGGPDKSVLDCLSQHMPFWDRSLEAVLLTHPHADHYFGLIEVVKRYKLNGFYTEAVKNESDGYSLLEAELASRNLSAKYISMNDFFKDKSGVNMKILWPKLSNYQVTSQNNADIDLNGLSVVALLTYGNFSILFTGDAGVKIMNELGDAIGDVDIIKVPHHGSRTGMSELFLKRIKPEIALISVGEKNKYGHPSAQSLSLLKSNKVKFFRTDHNGFIEIVSDGKSYLLKTAK